LVYLTSSVSDIGRVDKAEGVHGMVWKHGYVIVAEIAT
jgi:hypothetical protein